MDWPNSFHHEELSPSQKIARVRGADKEKAKRNHEEYVGRQLRQSCHISDGRMNTFDPHEREGRSLNATCNP